MVRTISEILKGKKGKCTPEAEKEFENGEKLPLVEDFYSIQGEGFHAGKPAYFVRLGGCDIGCNWCDTKFAWDRELHPLVDVETIVEKAASCPSRSVVVTGGEPFSYPLDFLCHSLANRGLRLYVETSGAYPLTGEWDWICLSPKRQSPPLQEFYEQANELKVIIEKSSDFEWAEENALKVKCGCALNLQPEWSNFKKILPLIVEYVKKHPHWCVSIQAQRFMKIP